MNVTVKLHSTKVHHGARTMEHKEKATSSALAKIKKSFTQPEVKQELEPTSQLFKGFPAPKAPGVYGDHQGQNHVLILGKFEASTMDFDLKIDRYDNAILYLEGHSTIDIKALKNDYRSNRSIVTEEFFQKYGSGMSGSVLAAYQNACAKFSFDYVESQIIIIVTDGAPFPGSHLDEVTHLYTCAVKSKKCYTQILITKPVRSTMQSMIATGKIPDGVSIRPSALIATGKVEKSDKGSLRINIIRANSTDTGVKKQRNIDPESWAELEA